MKETKQFYEHLKTVTKDMTYQELPREYIIRKLCELSDITITENTQKNFDGYKLLKDGSKYTIGASRCYPLHMIVEDIAMLHAKEKNITVKNTYELIEELEKMQ